MRGPGSLEVLLQVVLVLLAGQVLKLLHHQGCCLVGLVLLDDLDSVVAVLRKLLEDVLQVLVIGGSIQLLLRQCVSLIGLSLEGFLQFHLV